MLILSVMAWWNPNMTTFLWVFPSGGRVTSLQHHSGPENRERINLVTYFCPNNTASTFLLNKTNNLSTLWNNNGNVSQNLIVTVNNTDKHFCILVTIFDVEVVLEKIMINRAPVRCPNTTEINNNLGHLAEHKLLPFILSDTKLEVWYGGLDEL